MNLSPATDSHWTVDSAVVRCAGRTPYTATDLRFACLGLFRHVLNGQPGIVLTDENVFAPAAIESFIASLVNFKAASRSNLRSVLYRMSEVLLGVTAKGNSAFALPSSDPSEPYTDEESAGLELCIRFDELFQSCRGDTERTLETGSIVDRADDLVPDVGVATSEATRFFRSEFHRLAFGR
jgi:hypothetical protein